MEFLIIVAALLLHRVIPDLSWLHKDSWYANGVARLSDTGAPIFNFVVSLFVPTVVVLVVVWVLNHHWYGGPLFVFGLIGLMYTLGRGDIDTHLDTLEEDFSRHDIQAAYHDAAAFNVGHDESEATSGKEFHLDLIESVSYRFFEHYFPVIFWFAFFGVPGALLYRLSQMHTELKLDEGEQKNIAERWLWIMEWLPARLLGMSFALVGNFASCMHRWRECLFCLLRSTKEVLGHYVIGALSADVETAAEDISVAELEMVRRLFYRALILWVCVIALLIVF